MQKLEKRLKVVQEKILARGSAPVLARSSAVLCRPVDAEEDAEWTEYPSARAAARALRISRHQIARIARGLPAEKKYGLRKSTSGYDVVWRDDLVVQCGLCNKWRKLPSSASRKLPKHWSCKLNPDKAAASCEIAEEQWSEAEAEAEAEAE